MTTKSAQAAIAALIELAQQGEINPWDVQVIDVIDRFLGELALSEDTDISKGQANLSQSGQAFLWASMLVLLKANTLENLAVAAEEIEEANESEELENQENQRSLPLDLENRLRRRSAAPGLRKRRVTLQELIEQIEQIAVALEEPPSRSRPKTARIQSRRDATRIITQLAHQENLTEVATQLEQFLREDLPHLASEQAAIDLDDLVHCWNQLTASRGELQENPTSYDRVGVFWALLLLCAQSKVELDQSEFYQELKIRLIL